MRVVGLAALVMVAITIACGEPERTAPLATATAILPSTLTLTTTPTFTPLPTATATLLPTPTFTPLPTAIATSSPTPTQTSTPTFTPLPTATATPSPTSTPLPSFSPPEHMAYAWWSWDSLDRTGYRELVIDFTIHNDPESFPLDNARNGLYMMLGWGKLAENSFYFGIQSNVHAAAHPHETLGKAVIFSRWGTRDLALAKWDETDGFAQSSGHEGDFIGVRRLYQWGPGDYRVRLALSETSQEGDWFGLWITNLASDTTTWVGSLMFPTGGKIVGSGYSTMEVYGDPIHIEDIPFWHVSIDLPRADGQAAQRGRFGYSMFTGEANNADIQYSRDEGTVHIRAGGATERIGQAGTVTFD